MKEFRRLGPDELPAGELADRIVEGWGNAAWSAQSDYIRALVRHARQTTGPILECGSGLSSVLLGTLLRGRETRVWSLEHHSGWAKLVRKRLKRLGISSVRVVLAPLVDNGEYAWYDVAGANLPEGFSLVLCDGPPADTKGGRTGLLPQMLDRLAPDAVILVDDMSRPAEQAMVNDWITRYGGSMTCEGEGKPLAVYRAPAQRAAKAGADRSVASAS